MNKITAEQYKKLRNKIIESNPDIESRPLYIRDCLNIGSNTDWIDFEDQDISNLLKKITLSDVLMACKPLRRRILVTDHGHIYRGQIRGSNHVSYWDLKNNSLDWHYNNKPETVKFLFDLLVCDE